MTIKTCFLGGYRSLTRELSNLASLTGVTVELLGGDIILYGCLEKLKVDSDTINKRLNPAKKSFDEPKTVPSSSNRIDDPLSEELLLEQWKNYASKSEHVYNKLYPDYKKQ